MENAEDSDPVTSSSQPGSSGEISMPRGNRKGKGQSREETHPSSTPKLHAHVDDADSNNDETGHSSGASGNDERQGSVNRKGSFEGESDGIMGINKGNRKAKRKGKCELRLFTVDSDSNPDITKLDIFTPFHSSSDPKIPPVSGTLEVGDGGFTAVLSADFDLLQLTAPSNSNCGLVFARGNFPDSSVLSRGQRSGFGFGLRIPHDIDYQLNDYLSEGATRGRVRTRDDATSGWLNYRWPVTRELFQREDSADGEAGEVVSAWYVKDGSLIQVSRIARVHSRKENGSANHTPLEVGYKIGSLVRFGCCCTNRAIPTPDAFPPPFKLHLHTSQLEEDEKLLVIDDKDLGATMCVQCFCDEEPLKLQWKPETTGNAHAGIDFGFTGFVTLMDKPIILISMFSLCGFTTAQRKSWNKPPSLEEIEKDLGISSAGMKSGLLWKSDNSARADGFRAARKYDGQELHQLKLNLIGRTVEYILSVAVVPLFNTGNDTQPIAILSNIVSSMRIDVHTFFWQIRALIKVYEYIEPLRNIKKLGVICSKYRLRIQQTLLGAITWVYLCLGRLEEGGEELDSHAEQRWYFVTGKLGILRNGCHRGQAQLVYLKHCVRFLHGNPERSMPQSHSTGYTHWILYWSLTLAYVLQNANTPKLKDYIISQKKLNEKLHQRAQQDGARIETYSLSHSFLRWFTALFFSLARLFDVREDDPNVRTEQIKYEATTRKELQKHWETEKIRRMSEHRPKDLYTALDELNDRMALLVYELHHEPTRELANTLIGDVGRLMLRRKFTTQIKPPRPIDWRFKSEFVNIRIKNSRRMIGEEVHWSPWELSCNNFIIDMHSKCMVVQILAERTGRLGISAKNISEIFDKGCRRFIQRGYSIVTSWDETLPETMSDWWSMETDSLLAVSLVEMLRAAEVLERSSAASGESTSSTSDLESSVDLDEDQFRNAPSARSGGSYNYECSYLSKKIKEDDIRIRLHQTMRQKLSVKIQKGIFNAMVELEKRRLLEPSTDQSATAEKYLSEQEYDSSTDSSISLEELESDIPPVDSTPDPSAVTDSLPPDDASEPGSMRDPSAKIPGIYAATNGEESPTMYLALAGTEKTLDKRYPLETDSAGSPYVPEGYHDVDGGPRESESPPGFQRLFKLLIPDHRAFFCNNMYINDADVKPILEWDGKVLIYRNDTLLYDIKPHANGRLVDTPEPPHPPDISKELVLFRKFSSPLTLPTFTPPPKSFAAPTMRSPPALTPEYVHPAELEPSFKKSPEGAPASSDIPNPPAPARTHRRRAPSPSYFAKAYSSAFTRVPSEYTSAPLGYPPDHFGNQSPLRTTQVSPAGPSVLSPQTRGTPGFIDRSKGVRFNPQTRVREFKAPGSETGAGESASDITDSSAAAHTQLPAITSNSYFQSNQDPISQNLTPTPLPDDSECVFPTQCIEPVVVPPPPLPPPVAPPSSPASSCPPSPWAPPPSPDGLPVPSYSFHGVPTVQELLSNPDSYDFSRLQSETQKDTSVSLPSEPPFIISASYQQGISPPSSPSSLLPSPPPRPSPPPPVSGIYYSPPLWPLPRSPDALSIPPYSFHGASSMQQQSSDPNYHAESSHTWPEGFSYTRSKTSNSYPHSLYNFGQEYERIYYEPSRSNSLYGADLEDRPTYYEPTRIHPRSQSYGINRDNEYYKPTRSRSRSYSVDQGDENADYYLRLAPTPGTNPRPHTHSNDPYKDREYVTSHSYIRKGPSTAVTAIEHGSRREGSEREWAVAHLELETGFNEDTHNSTQWTDDFNSIFMTGSAVIYPDYMITSLEDTPEVFELAFTDRVAACEVKNLNMFFDPDKSNPKIVTHNNAASRNNDPAFDARNFPGAYKFLENATGLTIADFDSQYRLSIYNRLVGWGELAKRIVDNRVDTDAKYRIVSVDSYTTNIARLHLVVLHSEAVAAMDHYFGGDTHFHSYDVDRGLYGSPSLTWDTYLTFGYHEIRGHTEQFDVEPHRNITKFPPKSLLFQSNVNASPSTLIQSSLCFVITGAPDGRTWTCSMMGRQLSEYFSNHDHADELRQLIGSFAHDPRAARCLVAQTLVGVMLEAVALSYAKIIETLDDSLHISDQGVVFDAFSLEDSTGEDEMDLKRFKNILAFNWAIQCLESFKENILDVKKKGDAALKEMDRLMDDTKSHRSSELRQISQDVVRVQCNRRMAALETTLQDVLRRQQKTTAYRDGISNFMSLEVAAQASQQSATAVRQGNHIRILTLITITYLPLSLSTSVFGMGIMPSSVNFATFGWVLSLSLLLTVLGVYNAEKMTDGVRNFGGCIRKFAESTRSSRRHPQSQQSSSPTRAPSFGLAHPRHSQSRGKDESQFLRSADPQARLTSSPQRTSNWVWVFLLLRYFFTTFPASEAAATLSFLISFFTSAPAVGAAQPIAAQSNLTQPQPAPLGSSAATPPATTETTPAPLDHCSVEACRLRWETHVKECNVCNPQHPLTVSNSTGVLHRAISSSNINPACGVENSLLTSLLDAQDGRPMLNKRVSTHNRHPHRPSRGQINPCDLHTQQFQQHLQLPFTQPRKLVLIKSFTNSILQSGQVDRKMALRSWTKTLVSRSWFVGFRRCILFPLWICVLIVDYVCILVMLVLLGGFVDFGFAEEPETTIGPKGKGVFSRMARWFLTGLVKPAAIILKDTDFAEEEDS